MATTETRTFTEGDVLTAMCLWEAFLDLSRETRGDGDDAAIDDDEPHDDGAGDDEPMDAAAHADDLIANHGSATIRDALIHLIGPCERGWEAHVASQGEGDQFDWHWCPRFVREAMRDGSLDAAIDAQYGG